MKRITVKFDFDTSDFVLCVDDIEVARINSGIPNADIMLDKLITQLAKEVWKQETYKPRYYTTWNSTGGAAALATPAEKEAPPLKRYPDVYASGGIPPNQPPSTTTVYNPPVINLELDSEI